MALPLARLPYVRQQFLDANGAPLSNGYLQFFEVGTSTPAEVWADADGNVSLGVEVDLDASGVAPSIFVGTFGYDVDVYDQNDVLQTRLSGEQVEDIGASFLGNLGLFLTDGERDVASGYTPTTDDNFITTDSTDATNPFVLNLPLVTTRTQPLGIQHNSAFDLTLTPDATNSLFGLSVSTTYTVPAAASPNFPTLWLAPDADGITWRLIASHGL